MRCGTARGEVLGGLPAGGEVTGNTVVELAVPLVDVTHSVAEARLLADQVVRIERGKVVARGAAEVLANVATLEE